MEASLLDFRALGFNCQNVCLQGAAQQIRRQGEGFVCWSFEKARM